MEEKKQEQVNENQTEFVFQKHVEYLLQLDNSKDIDSIGYYLTDHLRVPGAYWTLNALACLKQELKPEKKEALTEWLLSCQNEDGGFGGNKGHDSHITNTHYAILILILFDSLDKIDINKVVNYVKNLQQEDGSFFGDQWGEIDTRFSYCALSCLALLNKSDQINVKKACEFVLTCKNFDGSFGGQPDAESHGAYVFTAVGALKIGNYLDQFDKDELGYWLSERQTPKGGFNGRPEKLPDVCYSWWIYSAFRMIERVNWIDNQALENFIINCQDDKDGGIGDRPGNCVDVFHTFFGVAALSLLNVDKYQLLQIDPTFALPKNVLRQEKYKHIWNLLEN